MSFRLGKFRASQFHSPQRSFRSPRSFFPPLPQSLSAVTFLSANRDVPCTLLAIDFLYAETVTEVRGRRSKGSWVLATHIKVEEFSLARLIYPSAYSASWLNYFREIGFCNSPARRYRPQLKMKQKMRLRRRRVLPCFPLLRIASPFFYLCRSVTKSMLCLICICQFYSISRIISRV